MIELKNLSIRRDGRVLFSNANLQIHPNFKVGLTGNNGTGKSSFFALLLGQLSADTGSVSVPANWQIGHMAQEIQATDRTAIDFVLSGDSVWYRLNQVINNPHDVDQIKLADFHSQFDDIDGYAIPSKAKTIMAGLGFGADQENLPVASFSGGWRMRLNLAKTLMSRADLLLLDEPTNHLDLDAILWLENWLQGYDGTLIMISHDQAFLDNVVTSILHIEHQSMTLYTGNYSAFVKTRSERLAQHAQAVQKQEATKAHLEDFIRRFRAKATKARQAQARIKQLEKMTVLAPVIADNPFTFEFFEPVQLTSPLITLDNASVGYNQTPLIDKIDLQITPDTRIGLLGMNGAGKSTIIKAIVGDLPILSGTYKISQALTLGYFNQHQMDALDDDATPMLMLRRLAGQTPDDKLRAFLGSFDFRGDRIDTPSRLFSGGECARLTLALIVWQRPNVLVLDEPTNHLDLQMRQALSVALQNFAGAVILVSHDREMTALVCDELYLVHNGRCLPFDGDITAYSDWLASTKKATILVQKNQDLPQQKLQATTLTKDEIRKKNAKMRELTAPVRQKIGDCEKQLISLGKKLTDIETTLNDTTLYEDAQKSKLLKILDEQTTLNNQLADTEDMLMSLMIELEQIEHSFNGA